MTLVSAIEAVTHTYNRRSEVLSFLVQEWVSISMASAFAIWLVMTNQHFYEELVHFHVSTLTTFPFLIVALGFASGYLVMKEEEVSGLHSDPKTQGLKIILTWVVLCEWLVLSGYLLDWTSHFAVNGWVFTAFFTIAIIGIRIALQEGGDLHGRKKILPGVAMLGGVLVPAAVYLALTHHLAPELARDGWPTATPTDIAFATTLMVLCVYKTVNAPAVIFLLTVAVLDDLVGIGIIATWYTQPATSDMIGAAALVLSGIAIAYFLKRKKVRNFLPYVLVAGQLHWWALYVLGVEPALGFLIVIFMMPIDKPKTREEHHMLEELDDELKEEQSHRHTAPVQVLMEVLERPVIFILGFFALANAGVRIESDSFGSGFYLVAAGLVIGKPLGIVLFTMVGMKLLRIPLPSGMGVKDLIVVGFFAGMGFTVSLFITETAFSSESVVAAHKAGAMAASLIAFACGYVAAKIMGVKPYISAERNSSQAEPGVEDGKVALAT